jgi:hypothetical protein
MTEKELAEGYYDLKKEFYTLSNICKRVVRFSEIPHPGVPQFFYMLFNNIAGAQTLFEAYKSMNSCCSMIQSFSKNSSKCNHFI